MNQTKRNLLAGVLITLGYPLKLCFWGLILGVVATVCLIVGLIISAILPEGDYPPSTALQDMVYIFHNHLSNHLLKSNLGICH